MHQGHRGNQAIVMRLHLFSRIKITIKNRGNTADGALSWWLCAAGIDAIISPQPRRGDEGNTIKTSTDERKPDRDCAAEKKKMAHRKTLRSIITAAKQSGGADDRRDTAARNRGK